MWLWRGDGVGGQTCRCGCGGEMGWEDRHVDVAVEGRWGGRTDMWLWRGVQTCRCGCGGEMGWEDRHVDVAVEGRCVGGQTCGCGGEIGWEDRHVAVEGRWGGRTDM